ncbi:MAG TPA: class I SAM-dependent methyltransferase, partial [Candidatus Baltobacteraceae bacterium]|nr:class I SAM-dependent methyltransferase [Candidatus Baltobacteraceae bacterium]
MIGSSEHIAWKTDAWKERNMVASYAQRVSDAAGWNQLKNRVEADLFARYAFGRDILDIGIGTGRASLPLARAGYNVTGVDSSQAMLDKCRELAGATPISLQVGDVAALPFADSSFDTVTALNTIAHFPHWQTILREWRRVVRDGGRMIFDLFSLDHDTAYAQATGESAKHGIENLGPQDVGSYYLRVPASDLVAFADETELRIVAVVPYSVFFGKGGFNRFF